MTAVSASAVTDRFRRLLSATRQPLQAIDRARHRHGWQCASRRGSSVTVGGPLQATTSRVTAVHRSKQCAKGWRPKRIIQGLVHCQSRSSFTFAPFTGEADIQAQPTDRTSTLFAERLSGHWRSADTFSYSIPRSKFYRRDPDPPM